MQPKITILARIALIAVLLASISVSPSGAQNSDRTAWATRLAALHDAHQAEAAGKDLSALPPEEGMEIFLQNWNRIPDEKARQAFLSAFRVTAKRLGPLDQLHLQVLDASPSQQVAAFSSLVEYAFQNFAEDYPAYLAWYQCYRLVPVEQVKIENVRAYVKRLAQAKGHQRDILLHSGSNSLRTRDPAIIQAEKEAGLMDVLARWLADSNADQDMFRTTANILSSIPVEEAYVRKYVLPLLRSENVDAVLCATQILGNPCYTWAVDALLNKLIAFYQDGQTLHRSFLAEIAEALDAIGDPRVIPTMIGLIENDNTYNTVYGIGYFGLEHMTGIPYDEAHDGTWWRQWWEKNKARYPEAIRKMEIPDFRPGVDLAEEHALEADPHAIWLRDHAAPIRSIAPGDDDVSDLLPLKKAIGNARIVQLGEESHGDGATFYAKCRLVRFLHEKMNFDVLAWESGLFDCHRMEAALHTDLPLNDAIEEGIFPIWGVSGQVSPVFAYARSTYKTARPLEMAGFDCQFSANHSIEYYPRYLFAFFDRVEPGWIMAVQRQTIRDLAGAVLSGKYHPSAEQRQTCQLTLRQILDLFTTHRAALQRVYKPREIDFCRRTVENLSVFEEMEATPPQKGASNPSDTNVRDRRMAQNLIWLARTFYPNKKIIVWAASFHLMRNAPTIHPLDPALDYKTTIPMGEGVHEPLGDQVYTIAFTAYRGMVGNPFFGDSRLATSEKGTLEAFCHGTQEPYLFIDLRHQPATSWLRKPLVARPLGYTPMQADWSHVFDAFFFTDRMFPSSPDGWAPTGVLNARRSKKSK